MGRNSEIVAATIWSPARKLRLLCCRLGHRVERVVTVEATNALGRSESSNQIVAEEVLAKTNKRMNGTNSTVVGDNRKIRFGSKSPLKVEPCRTADVSEGGRSGESS